MPNPIPSQLGLIAIADDSEIVASDHRNNYSDIQTAVNTNIVALTSGEYAGSLLYAPDSSHLAFLPDAPANGDVLVWNATDSRWEPGSASGGGGTTYRKTTAQTVNNTVSETDLLNGEITLAAGVLGTDGMLRLTAEGDWLQNASPGVALPRFKVKLGGTTLLDTGVPSTLTGQSSTRRWWRVVVKIQATASNAQNVFINLEIATTIGGTANTATFATGTGLYEAAADATTSNNIARGYSTGSVATSGAVVLAFTVVNGTASTNYETRLLNALVEII